MNEDHDIVMKHENQLNGSDGIVDRVNEIEVWKNAYLLNDRKETCLGKEALEKYIEETKKSKEGEMEMTKAKVSSRALILVALISSILGPGLMTVIVKLLKI